MNNFGGNWTVKKMNIVIDYAKAYLKIMSKQSWAKTIYFDGFAGSGSIKISEEEREGFKGAALRVLEIKYPRPFDMYYFVELSKAKSDTLRNLISKDLPSSNSNVYVIQDDCNNRLKRMSNYLKNNPNYRALVFIDPFGMSVEWSSIECLKNLGVDLWILVPTGVGVNRLLKNDGQINEKWIQKLIAFLGIDEERIKTEFYNVETVNTLFGEETMIKKELNAIEKIYKLYVEKLKEVFKFVSNPYVLRNSNNSIMYHFMLATNNNNAMKIANDVIKPENKLKE